MKKMYLFKTSLFTLLLFCSFVFTQANSTFTLMGDASNLTGGCYQLTSNGNDKRGAVWSSTKIDLSNSFVATFQIDIGFGGGNADGMTFAFHRDSRGMNTLGGGNQFLGFGGLNSTGNKVIPGMAVAFEGYIAKDMEIWSNGNRGHAPGYTYNNIGGTGTHDIRVEWNALTKTLTADWDDDGVDLTVNEDIVNTIFGGDSSNIIWGFTAATGGASYEHEVCDIQLVETSHATAPASIPTISEWGLIVLALLFMICGTLFLVQTKGVSHS